MTIKTQRTGARNDSDTPSYSRIKRGNLNASRVVRFMPAGTLRNEILDMAYQSDISAR